MPQIPTTLSRSPRVHGSSFAADARKLRTLSARIFAELLPWSTVRIATLRRSLHPLRPRAPLDSSGEQPSGGAST